MTTETTEAELALCFHVEHCGALAGQKCDAIRFRLRPLGKEARR